MAFHRAIWTASDNRKLISIAENLVGQLRAGSGSSSQVPGRIAKALIEHEAIIAALARGASALGQYWRGTGPEG